jgi:signal transduction histidine kinase
MRGVVSEGLNLFSALARPSVEIRTEIDAAIPLVKADATLALHLVINLCTNAYQAMAGAEGVLTVGLRSREKADAGAVAQSGVEFWVSDTGHGMDPVTVERIFEPFFTTRSVGQGTGLGLSVAHGIVESFGASIAVETEVGAGTTFRIFFPTVAQPSVNGEADVPVA